ncbi:glycosyl hydrolase 5 family protein-like [Bidens hawaiensis]|uniref:glycosyl hydrolase 5 family protein-like n=1 Tax=Bidens hawaiensis TaxID=980011 RepID=UPI00404B8845
MERSMRVVIISTLFLFILAKYSHSLPLLTNSRWVVDNLTGERVKFKCVNWPAHLQPMLAEGLDKKPISHIGRRIASLGFNCVRLTWATRMFTRYSNKTVVQTFRELDLMNAISGIKRNNPRVLDLTVVDAFSAVINVITSLGMMVVLDNHVSEPMWCCSNNDGNGFFRDKYFDPREWLNGLSIVGQRYRNTHMVVAMSLRNELRGPRQNANEWYRWVHEGTTLIHRVNPHVLVLVSGLNYALDFTTVKTKLLGLEDALPNKLVFEAHRYSWSGGRDAWLHQPLNKICNDLTNDVDKNVGFFTTGSHRAPLFITEFGVNLMGTNRADNNFLPCYMAYLAGMDLDWALWGLQGSYYLRQGAQNMDEQFGLLDTNWTGLRNPGFNRKLYLLHQTLQDPKVKSSNYTFMYHPLTGLCIRPDHNGQILADECHRLTGWSHDDGRTPIQLSNSRLCMEVVGDGLPVRLTMHCSTKQSTWKWVPNSMFQIASKDNNGVDLCLDYDPNCSSNVLSRRCICSGGNWSKCLQNPQSQWFQFVSTNSKRF